MKVDEIIVHYRDILGYVACSLQHWQQEALVQGILKGEVSLYS
jgi:hypothetical protein